nr:MAG TPA: hypothetical protein [Caudoviricetes sp.]
MRKCKFKNRMFQKHYYINEFERCSNLTQYKICEIQKDSKES